MKKVTKKNKIPKLETKIKGLDKTLEGGLPKGRATLVTGNTGCGKTVLLNEFLYRGIEHFNEPGVFVTFEEPPEKISENVKEFGWKYDDLVKQNKLIYVDFSKILDLKEVGKNYDLEPIIVRIKNAIKKINAKRVAIDSLGNLFSNFENKSAVRYTILKLSRELEKLNVTVLISAEKKGNEQELSLYGVQEFVVDGVLDLQIKAGQNKMLRSLIIRKMRGVSYRSGKVEFEILENGIQVYPKVPTNRLVAKTDFSIRKKFGIPKLDKALGEGIPQGHIMLVGGNSGSGKTTLGLHFVHEGVSKKEKCIWVALEEPVMQVKKTALENGINLEKHEKNNYLRFISASLLDISPDKLLYQILDCIKEIGAKRVVIDSVSSIFSATMNRDNVREFLIQASGFFKELGITCLMNYLISENFGAESDKFIGMMKTNDMRLSSIVDGIILLRYVERKQEILKVLNILKLRGSEHSKKLFSYELGKKGFTLGEKFG